MLVKHNQTLFFLVLLRKKNTSLAKISLCVCLGQIAFSQAIILLHLVPVR